MNLTDAYDSDNVFAKILRGEIPSVKLFENDATLAFMDVMPQAEGHCLVIPKEPCTNFLQISADAAAACMRTAHHLAPAVQRAVQADGFMILQLNGSAAGQTVPHYHLHIVPRHNGLEIKFHARDPEEIDVLEATAKRIRAELG